MASTKTPVADRKQDTTASKTITALFRVQVNTTKDVIYRVRNGQDREYLVTISANGNTACTQCANDEPCPSTKTAGRKCYHIKECLKLEAARATNTQHVPNDDTHMSRECPVNVLQESTTCPQDALVELPVEGDRDLPEEDRRYIVPCGPVVIDNGDGQSIYEDEEFSDDVARRWTQEALDRAALVATCDPCGLTY